VKLIPNFILIFCFALSFQVKAQVGFFNTENLGIDFARGQCVTEFNDSTYVGFGKVFENGWLNRTMGFFVFDIEGEVIRFDPISDSLEFYNDVHNSMFKFGDHIYAMPTGNAQVNPLLKYNPISGEIETQLTFSSAVNDPISNAGFESFNDGSFVVNLIEGTNIKRNNKIVILNDTGVLNSFIHEYDSSVHTESLLEFKITKDSTLMFYGSSNYNDNSLLYHPFLIEYDLEGNVLWRFAFPQGYQYFFGRDMLSLENEILLSYNRTDQNFTSNETRIIKIDKSLGIIWDMPFGSRLGYSNGNDFNRIIESQEGDGYILSGGLYKEGTAFQSAIIGKISLDGDSLWMNTFNHTQNWNDTNVFKDLEQTSDGGYILIGRHVYGVLDSVPENETWISVIVSKVNRNGELSFTSSYLPSSTPNLKIEVYPNPVHSHLNIICEVPIKEVELFSLQGVKLKKEIFDPQPNIVIEVADYSEGIYFLKISTGQRSEVIRIFKF